MGDMSVAVLVAVASTTATQYPAHATASQLASPHSINRIRKMLDQPADLRLPTLEPTAAFKVEVREWQLFLEPLFKASDFDGGPLPPGGLYAFEQRQRLGGEWKGQPLIEVDLLPVGKTLGMAIRNALHSRARSAALEDVQRTVAEFCATHSC